MSLQLWDNRRQRITTDLELALAIGALRERLTIAAMVADRARNWPPEHYPATGGDWVESEGAAIRQSLLNFADDLRHGAA